MYYGVVRHVQFIKVLMTESHAKSMFVVGLISQKGR